MSARHTQCLIRRVSGDSEIVYCEKSDNYVELRRAGRWIVDGRSRSATAPGLLARRRLSSRRQQELLPASRSDSPWEGSRGPQSACAWAPWVAPWSGPPSGVGWAVPSALLRRWKRRDWKAATSLYARALLRPLKYRPVTTSWSTKTRSHGLPGCAQVAGGSSWVAQVPTQLGPSQRLIPRR